MSTSMRLGIVGCGAMAEAMLAGALAAGAVGKDNVVCSHPRAERRDDLATRFGVATVAHNEEAAQGVDVVLMGVKPQMMPKVAPQIAGALAPTTLVVSIAAGIPLSYLGKTLEHARIVRAMPNTPARIGHGTTVWCATDGVEEAQRQWCHAFFSALGLSHFTADEKQLAMATAISGTGPMYVFLFVEALMDAAVALGFSRHDARELVTSTLMGSAQFVASTDRHAAQLRNDVTSPAGTSAAALYELEKGSFRTVVHDAVTAAFRRARELEDGA